MFSGALLLFFIHAVSGHTAAQIFRYVGYTGCDTVTGSVTVHAASGVQQMILNLRSLPSNATGFIQIRNGVNCFESDAGEIYLEHAVDAFPFEANVNGVVSDTLDFGNVTVDEMMGRTVHVLLEDDNSTTRIACGTVGLSYPSTVGAYPGAAAQVEGSIAVTGPLKAEFGEGAHGPTKLQLAFDLVNLEPGVTGKLEVHSGNSCDNETAVGTLWGTNWTTTTYTADANGVAVGYADITWVSSLRNLSEYFGRVVVVRDSSDAPVACGVIACPEGTVEATDDAGARRGFCRPAVSWAFSHVIAADLYSHSSPVQVQVSGAAFELAYSEVRSIPTCAASGNSVTTTFFVKNGGSVDQLAAGQFQPVTGVKQVVVLGDKQPVSVGRQDNYVNVSFAQSTQNNTHDVVHLAVGVSDLIFHVAAPGHRQETRLTFGSKSTIAFPTGAVPTNTTVWITDAATKAVIYQKGFLFGKPSPNFVWFLYGWDSAAADCSSGQRNCTDFPVAVTTYPVIRGDYGDGVIPPVESGSLATCLPGFLVLALTALFF